MRQIAVCGAVPPEFATTYLGNFAEACNAYQDYDK